MATKIIKFNNGSTTYVPVTTSEAIQHSWGDASKQQLKSYLGDLKASLDSSIATVAAAELATRNNLAATYIKAGASADKISYNLPNGTYGLITVNNVARAKGADTADKLGSKSIDFNSLNATISYKIGDDYVGEFEAKASNSAYGFTKVETAPTAGSTNAISSGYVKTLATKVDGKAATNHTHSLTWKTSAKTSDAGSEINVLVDVPSDETQFGTATGEAQFTTYTLPTKKYVDDAVSGAFADVASALKYKGTIGTGAVTSTHVNSLPASHDVGDVWVVSSAGNYAGKACEVGDYIVCNTKGTAANDAHWDVLNGENQVSDKAAILTVPYSSSSSDATTIATIDGTDITLKTKHAVVPTYIPANTEITPDHGNTFTVISEVKLSNGHVTKLKAQDVKLPTETQLSKTGTNKQVALTHGGTFTYISNLNVSEHEITYDYATATLPSQDHTKSGSISAGKLTYWNGENTHTAVTASYGNSTSKYAYVENGVLKEGNLPTFTNSNDFSVIAAGADATGVTAGTVNTGSATADKAGDTLTVQGGNKWITTGVSDTSNADTLFVNHTLSGVSAQNTSDVYSIKFDAAGHITAAAAAATGTVGLTSLKYKVGNDVTDIDDAALGLTFGAALVDIAALTGDTTFVK